LRGRCCAADIEGPEGALIADERKAVEAVLREVG
jgi:hypothetical protein